MDIDEVMRHFDLLEKKIERLIKQCSDLEHDNFKLNEKVNEFEAVIAAKTKAENKYSEQKALIRSKIDSLLQRLEGTPGTISE